jgi:uncharacterized phage protein (TIGR01671 family)
MREFKFRAWDKDENRMHQDVDVLRNGQIIYFEVDEYGEPTHWHNNYDYNFEKKFSHTYIVMQYTGLKDKNGKEIYEGDIVSGGYDLYKVEFFEGAYSLIQGQEIIEFAEFINMSQVIELEVIGNIYENPDLLGN